MFPNNMQNVDKRTQSQTKEQKMSNVNKILIIQEPEVRKDKMKKQMQAFMFYRIKLVYISH